MRRSTSQIESQDGETPHAFCVIADPFRGGHLAGRDLAEAMAKEELRRVLFRRAGEDTLQLLAARFREDANEQLCAHTLALEPTHRVERYDLSRPIGLVSLADQR